MAEFLEKYGAHKILFDYLAIEVTRRCNMKCKHCLRGDAEDIDFDPKLLPNIFKNVSEVGILNFSGGEPSLNVAAMDATLEYVKAHNIPVYAVFVATNGKDISEAFIITLLKWYAYCLECGGDPDVSAVKVSGDPFHETLPKYDTNTALLKGLGFVYFEEDDGYYIINEGRAKELSSSTYKKRELEDFNYTVYGEMRDDELLAIMDCNIYVGANGEVKSCCDLSYDNHSHTLGNVNDSTLFDIMLQTDIEEL